LPPAPIPVLDGVAVAIDGVARIDIGVERQRCEPFARDSPNAGVALLFGRAVGGQPAVARQVYVPLAAIATIQANFILKASCIGSR
jgi:hypothetical protein